MSGGTVAPGELATDRWFGKLPNSWRLESLARLSRWRNGIFTDGDWVESPYIENDGIRLIQTGNIGLGSYREQGYRFISNRTFKLLACTEVYAGDLLICRLGDPVSRSCIAPDLGLRMITSVDVCILRVESSALTNFLNYVFNCQPYRDYVSSLVRGSTRDRVSRKMLGGFEVPVPPDVVIHKICDFLDHETAKIDALITKQEQLIATLQEERVAAITQAVTKGGITSEVMKESGVPGVDKVPSHWSVMPVKYLVRGERGSIKAGPFGSDLTSSEMSGDFARVYNQRTVLDKDILVGEGRVTRTKYHSLVAFAVKPGDILVTTRGTIGRAYEVPLDAEPGVIHPCVIRLRIDHSRLLNDFLLILMNETTVVREQLLLESNATTIDVVYTAALASVKIPVPPLEEMSVMIKLVKSIIEESDNAVAKSKEMVGALREYRSALIADAVTGKLDAREMG